MSLNFKNTGGAQLSRILFGVFAAICVVFLTLYSTEGPTGILHRIQGSTHAVMSPAQFVGTTGGAIVDAASTSVGDIVADGETLSKLKQQNEELTNLLAQTEEYRLEAQRLEGLLNLKETYSIEGVSGRVIGRSTDAWNQTITIDVGASNGVEAGLTVVGPSGVVGQVVSASSGSAVVRLLSDPQSGVAAIIQSSRAEGIVRGSLNGLMYLENVAEDVNVEVGDVVLTSGLGGSFTKGLLIGQVVRVSGKASDDTRQIIVASNENIGSLEEVIVVFSATDTDQSKGQNQAKGQDQPQDQSQGQPQSQDQGREGSQDEAQEGEAQ